MKIFKIESCGGIFIEKLPNTNNQVSTIKYLCTLSVPSKFDYKPFSHNLSKTSALEKRTTSKFSHCMTTLHY